MNIKTSITTVTFIGFLYSIATVNKMLLDFLITFSLFAIVILVIGAIRNYWKEQEEEEEIEELFNTLVEMKTPVKKVVKKATKKVAKKTTKK